MFKLQFAMRCGSKIRKIMCFGITILGRSTKERRHESLIMFVQTGVLFGDGVLFNQRWH